MQKLLPNLPNNLFPGRNVPHKRVTMNTDVQVNRSLERLQDFEAWNVTNPEDCNYFSESQSIFSTKWFRSIICFLYSTVFVVALTGNGLVCYVVHSSPRMKTVTNFFIVNLAFGDILMALFCVPTSSISTLILQYWPFGSEVCFIVIYLQVRLIVFLFLYLRYESVRKDHKIVLQDKLLRTVVLK